jgi:glyoxylase-like metal-dependent hydrolase (beta-lactamase superfamily II)
MNIETFYFNPYRECTYVLVNDHKQAVIIDAGMYETREQQRFAQYIQSHQLTPVALLITHAHPDHICGQEFIEKIEFSCSQGYFLAAQNRTSFIRIHYEISYLNTAA